MTTSERGSGAGGERVSVCYVGGSRNRNRFRGGSFADRPSERCEMSYGEASMTASRRAGERMMARSRWELTSPRWLASFVAVVVRIVGTDCETRVRNAEPVQDILGQENRIPLLPVASLAVCAVETTSLAPYIRSLRPSLSALFIGLKSSVTLLENLLICVRAEGLRMASPV